MTVLRLQHEDLVRVRFGFSPLAELVTGLRLALSDTPHPLHKPWLQSTSTALGVLDLGMLQTLMPSRGYLPDFLTPPPVDGVPSFAAELKRLAATPPERVRADLHTLRAVAADPAAETFDRFERGTGEALDRLTELLEHLWEATLEPHWPRIQNLHEADVAPRARSLALGGAEEVLHGLHPAVRFGEGRLEVRDLLDPTPETWGEIPLAGKGLLLVPAAFVWPRVSLLLEESSQSTLYYSPRGVANLWGESPAPLSDALEFAFGRGRAGVLLALSLPSTTLDLAGRLGVTSADVSHHLGRLRKAGLVEAQRQGRQVFYGLTERGGALLELFG